MVAPKKKTLSRISYRHADGHARFPISTYRDIGAVFPTPTPAPTRALDRISDVASFWVLDAVTIPSPKSADGHTRPPNVTSYLDTGAVFRFQLRLRLQLRPRIRTAP